MSKQLERSLCGSVLALAAISWLLMGSPARAQGPGTIAERLSPATAFYVQWRGMPYLSSTEKTNHVLQLMSDPSMAPVWASLAADFQQNAQKQGKQKPPVTLTDLISLLDNPGVFGIAAKANASPSASRAASSAATVNERYGTFLVYDDTGKTALIEKLRAAETGASDQKPAITHYDFGGTTIEQRANGKDTSYAAQAGHYFVESNQKEIVEELITRFRTGSSPVSCITRLAEYGEIRKYIGADAAVELFARVPDVHSWAASDSKNQAPAKFLSDIHLDKLRVAGVGLAFEGQATRFRGAILGDTSAGGPFDVIGASSSHFETQPILGDGPTFSVWRMNVPAIYQLVRNAIVTNAPPQQAAGLLMIESMSARFLGMPLQSALELFRGEFASVNSYSEDGERQQLMAIAIQRPDDVLRVLRAAASSVIISEDSSGDATYLDLAYPYKDPKTGTQRRKFYYLAVTQEMILGAPRKAMLRQAAQQVRAETDGSQAKGIFGDPGYVQMRSHLPEKLSSLSTSDIAAVPWDKVIANLQEQENEAAQQSKSAPLPDLSQWKAAAPAISRHLRMAVSGSWKDANGVYFDSYVQ